MITAHEAGDVKTLANGFLLLVEVDRFGASSTEHRHFGSFTKLERTLKEKVLL